MRETRWFKIARELVYVAILVYIYEEIGGIGVQSGATATRHALSLVELEQRFGLFVERGTQSIFLHSHAVVEGFNLYYGGTHFLVPIGVLVWLALRSPADYLRARTVLAVTTGIGFLCFWLYPVAPPRLLPARFGFVDTIRHLNETHAVGELMDRAGNAYAALPSLHIAWAVWCTIALYPLLRRRWARWLAIAYPVMTVLVVVVTGNHYIADCVAGAALVGAVAWGLDRLSVWSTARRVERAGDATPVLVGAGDAGGFDVPALEGSVAMAAELDR